MCDVQAGCSAKTLRTISLNEEELCNEAVIEWKHLAVSLFSVPHMFSVFPGRLASGLAWAVLQPESLLRLPCSSVICLALVGDNLATVPRVRSFHHDCNLHGKIPSLELKMRKSVLRLP